ncbi:MAG: hypothetical protein V1787_00440 [Candidatus Micrarchaeota archaeon]
MDEFGARLLAVLGLVAVLLLVVGAFVLVFYRMKGRREAERDDALEARRERESQGFARSAIASELEGLGPEPGFKPPEDPPATI